MAGLNVEVDANELADCISRLKTLQEQCESSYKSKENNPDELTDKGKMPDKLVEIMNKYNGMRNGIVVLIQSTIELLENAKDGCIDVDDSTSNELYRRLEYRTDIKE